MRELTEMHALGIELREARPEDGRFMHALVERCGTLEQNSPYAYVLLADHFGGTSVVATSEGKLVGMALGYRPPTRPDAIFVWQIGVDPSMRGRGLGIALLDAFTRTAGAKSARFLEATVAPSNVASRALFGAFARKRETEICVEGGYPASLFPNGHEPEERLRIGPFSQ